MFVIARCRPRNPPGSYAHLRASSPRRNLGILRRPRPEVAKFQQPQRAQGSGSYTLPLSKTDRLEARSRRTDERKDVPVRVEDPDSSAIVGKGVPWGVGQLSDEKQLSCRSRANSGWTMCMPLLEVLAAG